jgi:sialidase-1
VSASSELWLNEATFVQLDDGTLVCYIREDQEQLRGYKAISRDDGATWQGPYPTHLLSCIGRPEAGLLRSGEVIVFYGFSKAPRLLVLHAESQAGAADPDCVENATKSHISPDFRRFFVEHDRSIHPDGAYSGWVQLPDGDLYVVQYIVDDAPMAFIRSYRISRDDWILAPEGGIPQIDHSRYKEALYHEQALDASAELYQRGTGAGPA